MFSKICKKGVIILVVLFIPMLLIGQIRIAEIVQTSKVTQQSEYNLYFIDFWATWCGPCITVSDYLTNLQHEYKNDLLIISLTKENPDIIYKFFEKHNTDLTVAIDFKAEMFSKYDVYTLPYGVLLNASGDVIWKGHPADLNGMMIRRFLRKNRQKSPYTNFIQIKKRMNEISRSTYIPTKLFEIHETHLDVFKEVQFLDNPLYTEIRGSLKGILAYIFNLYDGQINIDEDLNKYYRIYLKDKDSNKEEILNLLMNSLQLEYDMMNHFGEHLIMTADFPKFWDTNQIDWGESSQKYLIDDEHITADNISLIEMKYKLSSVLERPIVLDVINLKDDLHDWQIHYKYENLMQHDLLNNYGIKIKNNKGNYPVMHITKKAP